MNDVTILSRRMARGTKYSITTLLFAKDMRSKLFVVAHALFVVMFLASITSFLESLPHLVQRSLHGYASLLNFFNESKPKRKQWLEDMENVIKLRMEQYIELKTRLTTQAPTLINADRHEKVNKLVIRMGQWLSNLKNYRIGKITDIKWAVETRKNIIAAQYQRMMIDIGSDLEPSLPTSDRSMRTLETLELKPHTAYTLQSPEAVGTPGLHLYIPASSDTSGVGAFSTVLSPTQSQGIPVPSLDVDVGLLGVALDESIDDHLGYLGLSFNESINGYLDDEGTFLAQLERSESDNTYFKLPTMPTDKDIDGHLDNERDDSKTRSNVEDDLPTPATPFWPLFSPISENYQHDSDIRNSKEHALLQQQETLSTQLILPESVLETPIEATATPPALQMIPSPSSAVSFSP